MKNARSFCLDMWRDLAGLLLYLFRTRWSERARWEKEYRRLKDEYDKAALAHREAVVLGNSDHVQLRAHLLLCATNIANHRAAGQRAGFLDRAE